MKLILKNFKCWENSTFDFEGKLNLLSGKSGSGKSSILSAILFVLFGTGQKIIMQGKTACKVTLELSKENIIIERTKKPNRLTLKTGVEQYEDDVAQEIINKRFGKFFDTISYIQQDMFNSFVYLSPTDKLIFLEQFSFSGVDLKSIKERNKELIKQRYEQLIVSKSKVDTTEALLKEQIEHNSLEKIDFPYELYSVIFNKKLSKKAETQIDLLIKNIYTRYKNNNTTLNNSKKFLEKEKESLGEYKLYKQQLDIYTDKKINLEKQLQKLKNTQNENSSTENAESEILLLKSKLSLYLRCKEYKNKKTEFESSLKLYNQLLIDEQKKKEKELVELKSELSIDFKKEQIENELLALQTALQKQKEKEQLLKEKELYYVNENELDIMKSEFEILVEKIRFKKELSTCYSCPSCETVLKLIEGKLQLHSIQISDNDNRKLSDLVKLKDELETKINKNIKSLDKYSYIVSKLKSYSEDFKIEELKFKIKALQEVIEKQKSITSKIKALETSENLTLKNLKLKLNREQEELKKLQPKEQVEDEIDEEELRTTISKLEQEYNTFKIYSQTIFKLQKELKEVDSKLQTLICEKTEEDILTSMQELKTKIQTLEVENINVEKAIKVIEKYKVYIRVKERLGDIENRLEQYKEEEKRIESKYTSAKLLKEKILEAESIAITSTIENINTHAQLYLDTFFSDNPISVSIISFKEDMKGNSKAQINMKVEYKGMDCDFTSLSGGERQRISLAFTLALSEIFNSPLLLLDECTSNLDQESTSNIISSIKENYKGSIALLACHQVVTGIFDKIITI